MKCNDSLTNLPPLRLQPLQQVDGRWRQSIRLVATDMDGTLTQSGKFKSQLFQAFDALQQEGIQVLIVTGRSAGWVSGIVNYLNVAGAIAENGGIYYPSAGESAGQQLCDIGPIGEHRQNLQSAFEHLASHFPQLAPANDNAFRLTDWTFANPGFSQADLRTMQGLCEDLGWGFTYSAIQCHIKPVQQDKGRAVLKVAGQLVDGIQPDRIVTVGDSPNDESLFRAADFTHSVGVANIVDYSSRMHHRPAYVTTAPEGEGFCQFVEWLLDKPRLSGS